MHENMKYDEKERVKMSYLKCMKKTFKSLTKGKKKKKIERRDQERNRRDKQKKLLKKLDLIPI